MLWLQCNALTPATAASTRASQQRQLEALGPVDCCKVGEQLLCRKHILMIWGDGYLTTRRYFEQLGDGFMCDRSASGFYLELCELLDRECSINTWTIAVEILFDSVHDGLFATNLALFCELIVTRDRTKTPSLAFTSISASIDRFAQQNGLATALPAHVPVRLVQGKMSGRMSLAPLLFKYCSSLWDRTGSTSRHHCSQHLACESTKFSGMPRRASSTNPIPGI